MRFQISNAVGAALLYGLLVSSAAISQPLGRDGAPHNSIASCEYNQLCGRGPPIGAGLPKVGARPGAPGRSGGGRDGDEGDGPDPEEIDGPGSGSSRTEPSQGTGSEVVPASGAGGGAGDANLEVTPEQVQVITDRGSRNLARLDNAIAQKSDDVVFDYGAAIHEKYTVPAPQVMKLPEQVSQRARAFFKDKELDIGKFAPLGPLTGPSVKKVVVYGAADINKIPSRLSAFEAYANADAGWLWLARRFRTGDKSDNLYPGVPNEADRIVMSEHITHAWSVAGDGKRLNAIVSANVNNDVTVKVLDDVRAALPGNPTIFEITPQSNPAAWNAVNGGSVGGSVTAALRDHRSKFGDIAPTRASVYHDKADGIFVILHLEPKTVVARA